MIFAVIDTNVIVAALRSKHEDSATVRTMNAVFDGKVVPLYTSAILDEYRDVLFRPRLKLDRAKCEFAIAYITDAGRPLNPVTSELDFLDDDDRVFYEVALAGRDREASLVTGNLRHYPQFDFVLTPAEFCEVFGF
jgi:uncharacterized protein